MFTLLHSKSWAWLSKPTIQVHSICTLSPLVKFLLSPHWSNLYTWDWMYTLGKKEVYKIVDHSPTK